MTLRISRLLGDRQRLEAVARRKVEAAELQQLRRDNKRLQEENEILRKASAFFARWAEKA